MTEIVLFGISCLWALGAGYVLAQVWALVFDHFLIVHYWGDRVETGRYAVLALVSFWCGLLAYTGWSAMLFSAIAGAAYYLIDSEMGRSAK